MGSRVPVLPIAVVVLLLLVVVWAFAPGPTRDEGTQVEGFGRPARGLLASRPFPTFRPAGGDLVDRELPTPGVSESGSEERPTPRRRMTKRQRLLARRLERDLRNVARPSATERDFDSGDLEDGGGNVPRFARPSPPPGSPYENLADDEMVELIVGVQRLRDSGALRKFGPEDYLRITELMPESRGLQDADRIFRDVLGMGVGEWLAETRGGETYILE